MKNRQTIFKKYLWLSMIAVFLGFTILGVMIVFFVTQYWETERWDTLHSYATTVSLSITDKAVFEGDKPTLPQQSDDVVRDTVRTLSGGLYADIIVTDESGRVMFCSENAEGVEPSDNIDKRLTAAAMSGGIREVSDFGGVYTEKYYVAGVPVQVIKDGTLTPIGAVFVTSSTSHYKEYVITLVKIFCSAGIIIFALIFCFVGLFSYQLTKPLGQMAKAALNRLTKCLAWEWGPYHINVNAIAPGYTHSNLSADAPKEVEEEMTLRIPYGRYGEPIEIGALAVYLASEASDIMTGAVLTIDGGYSLAR